MERPTVEIPAQTMSELVYGTTTKRNRRPTMRTMILTLTTTATLLLAAISGAYAAPQAKPAKDDIHVATCNDGKEYYARTNEHRGACSGHKGVAKWADGTPVKASKASSYR